MSVDKKILEELNRYNKINKYLLEQDVAAAPPTDEPDLAIPAAGETSPDMTGEVTPPVGDEPQPVDVTTDPDVEKVDNSGKSEEKTDEESGTEELDVTDLVDGQKEIQKKQDDYFTQLFGHLETLESKLGEMDELINKVNSLEEKIEKYRPKTPQEKLELRSLDSGPFNQKLSDFFVDKEVDLEKTGKNEYVLTKDDVENYTPSEIRDTFNIETKKNFGL
jgi:hypothetical protein